MEEKKENLKFIKTWAMMMMMKIVGVLNILKITLLQKREKNKQQLLAKID